MIVGTLRVRLLLREARTLKDKRQVRPEHQGSLAAIVQRVGRGDRDAGQSALDRAGAWRWCATSASDQADSGRRSSTRSRRIRSPSLWISNWKFESNMKQHRIARVSEAIREVAAETILFELQDPRIKNVTVTQGGSVRRLAEGQDLCVGHGHAEGARSVHAWPQALGGVSAIEARDAVCRRASRRPSRSFATTASRKASK